MSETHNQNGFSVNERHADGGNVWRNFGDDLSQPFNHQDVQPLNSITPDEIQQGVQHVRDLIAETRQDLQPLASQADVVLAPTPSN